MMRAIFILGMTISISLLKAQCPEGLITGDNNLVKNGDFDEKSKYFESEYLEAELAGAKHFRITDNAHDFSPIYFKGKGDGDFMAVDGANGANITVWKQNIKIKKNTTYFFSCWVNTLNIKTGPPAVLQFSINDRLLDKPFVCPNKLNKWEQFFVLWNSEELENISIRIVSQNPDWDGNDFGLDRIKFYECEAHNLEIITLTTNTKTEEIIPVQKLEVNTVITLRNVLFKIGTSEIIPESTSDLNTLYEYLVLYKTAEMEIAGHTDNVGSEKSNIKLSQERANAIKEYLTKKGIDNNRLTTVGYGESKPISSNETIEGRQKNRRVEAIIKK